YGFETAIALDPTVGCPPQIFGGVSGRFLGVDVESPLVGGGPSLGIGQGSATGLKGPQPDRGQLDALPNLFTGVSGAFLGVDVESPPLGGGGVARDRLRVGLKRP
ncbi:hypothetical protein H0E87_031697, partial [Populus deltoides]